MVTSLQVVVSHFRIIKFTIQETQGIEVKAPSAGKLQLANNNSLPDRPRHAA